MSISERTQRILWAILAIIAVGLSVATTYLYLVGRRLTRLAITRPPYRIAYVSFSDDNELPQIYTCNLEGEDTRVLTESQVGDAFPISQPISAGSKEPRIAFLRSEAEPSSRSGEAGTPGGVYAISSNGGTATKVSGAVPNILGVAPSWSPDGKQLAFAGVEDLDRDGKFLVEEAGVYVCHVETLQVKRVATVNVTGLRLLWSPAGPQLILQAKKPNMPVPVAHLLVMESGKLTPIGEFEATTVACWSPDGQQIAAYSIADRQIHILHNDGREDYKIDAPPGYVVELVWAPTGPEDSGTSPGRLLAVSASQPAASAGQLFARSALPGQSETWVQLTDEESDAAYLAVSPDGRYVTYTLLMHSENPDLYLLEFGQDKPRQLTSDPGFEGLATWVSMSAK